MTTITLPPDLEQSLAEEADKRGTAPELLALDSLRQLFVSTEKKGTRKRTRPFLTLSLAILEQ